MKNKTLLIIAVCLLLLLSVTAHAQESWRARVVDVADGDTITVEPLKGGDRSKIRLHGVDAPERKQPYGESARAYATKIALYKQATIHVQPQGKDRYGRVIAIVDIDGAGVLQELLLQNGMAWVYTRYCQDCDAWNALQQNARVQGKGLWADENALPPWEWRKRSK